MKNDNGSLVSPDLIKTNSDQAISFLGKLIEYADDVDAILKDVAAHYNADRAYVFEISEDGKTLDNTYEWCKTGVVPQIDNLQKLPIESVSVWLEEFEKVGAFFISSLDKDVEANSLTYEILEPQGIESLITAPIYKNDTIIGFIGVDNPHENIDDIVILKTTASILYSELSRKIASKNNIIKEMEKIQLAQDKELLEIRDIIASANMGTWRIEIVDNEEPRMYVDNTMKMLLGITEPLKSPEQTYTDWFSKITPEALPSVIRSVERMQQGYFDENTYLWTHPIKGNRYVRCGGTSKKIHGGYSLQGYHYDVDEVVRKDKEQMTKLQLALSEKNEYYSTLGAVADIYYSMHLIDLKEDTVSEFNAKNEVKAIVNKKDGAREMMQEVMTSVTTDEYLQAILDFSNLSTISERMHNKKYLTKEFIGKNVGWVRSSFVTMEADEQGFPTKVIFISRVIDEEKKQEERLIKKTQTDELTGLLNRRAYEESIYQHNDLPEEDGFVYISIDVNGLKVVNDTKGHTAGDELIIGACQCMKKCLGPYGNVYRIGGDEFVAILYCASEDIISILNNFDKTVASWKGELVDELSVSYGWIDRHEQPEASTRQLGAIAEQRMYDAKAEYYRRKGVDRRGQQDAHKVLCALYTKILKINVTDDSYQIISMDVNEQTSEKGFADSISKWLSSFGTTGQVHPDDLNEYLRKTDLKFIKDYFSEGKSSLHIIYRRKYDNDYKQVMMELVPAGDYNEDNQSFYLYVKNIDT